MELVRGHGALAVPGLTVQSAPVQLERTISSGCGFNGFCNPSLWISSYLLVNPLLQTLLVFNSPTLAAQGFTCVVSLDMLCDFLNCPSLR